MIDLTAVVGASALSSRQISQLKEEWTLKTPFMKLMVMAATTPPPKTPYWINRLCLI